MAGTKKINAIAEKSNIPVNKYFFRNGNELVLFIFQIFSASKIGNLSILSH